jgi:hypothetical protein
VHRFQIGALLNLKAAVDFSEFATLSIAHISASEEDIGVKPQARQVVSAISGKKLANSFERVFNLECTAREAPGSSSGGV